MTTFNLVAAVKTAVYATVITIVGDIEWGKKGNTISETCASKCLCLLCHLFEVRFGCW